MAKTVYIISSYINWETSSGTFPGGGSNGGHVDLSNYYTIEQLQTEGQSIVDFYNIANAYHNDMLGLEGGSIADNSSGESSGMAGEYYHLDYDSYFWVLGRGGGGVDSLWIFDGGTGLLTPINSDVYGIEIGNLQIYDQDIQVINGVEDFNIIVNHLYLNAHDIHLGQNGLITTIYGGDSLTIIDSTTLNLQCPLIILGDPIWNTTLTQALRYGYNQNHLIITGGNADGVAGQNLNGGDVVIVPGGGFGTGYDGKFQIQRLSLADSDIPYVLMWEPVNGTVYYGDGGGTGGGVSLSGSTNNTICTVTGADAIQGEANLTYDGTDLTNSAGDMYADNFVLNSDRRLKTKIKSYKSEELIIDYKQFELKSDIGQQRWGVIAQEIQKLYPELVRENKDGHLSVSYIDLLIREVSNLKDRVKELENR